MFQRAPIVGLVAVLILSIAFAQPGLSLLCALLLITAGMARLWSHWSLRRVIYERRLSQLRAFPDDEIELTIRVTNRKLLPLAGLRIADRLPAAITVLNTATSFSGARQAQLLQRRTSLRWYESVSWRYTLRCSQRGTYRIGPAQLRSGDPFGLYSSDDELEQFTTLLVYPRLIELPDLGLPAHNPLGDVRAGQLLRDPLRTVGVRDYAPSDPLKDVHWAATARTGSLQTRVYEPTTSRVLAIFLDLDTFEFYYEGINPRLVERMISAAATAARQGLDAGYAVGLYANGAPAEFEHLARLPAGRSPAQLARIMETLARLTAYSVTTIGRVLQLTARDLNPGTTIMLIGSVNSQATRAALLRQRELGYRVSWLYMGGGEAPKVPGVRVIAAPTERRPEPSLTDA